MDRRLTARIAYKTAVDVTAKLVMLVVTIAAARRLPRDAFGVLGLALTTGWLLGVASDMGLPMYLARAAAREGRAVARTLRAVVRVRLFLAGVATLVALAVSWSWMPPSDRVPFVLIALSQIAAATLETVGHALRGVDRSELESHVHLAQRVAMGGAAFAVLATAPDVTSLALALLIPPLAAIPVMLATAGAAVRSSRAPEEGGGVEATWGPDARARLARGDIGLVSRAAPLGAAVLFSALYFRIDVFFVEQWYGLRAVAGYVAVFRIADAVRLMPAAALAVLFPTLCRAVDLRAAGQIAARLTLCGLAIAIPIGLGAPWVVGIVYGPDYADAAAAMGVLAAAIPFFFLNYVLTHQVIGWDGQRAYLAIAAVALVVNVAANAALVPPYGPTGAAAATVITELVVTAGCVRTLTGALHPRRAGVRVAAGGAS